jgi:hypothetical protein
MLITRQTAIALLCIVCIVLTVRIAPSEDRIVREYDLKAAFIYNIVKFVDWPEISLNDSELRIGILGTDPFGTSIDALKGKMVGKRRIIVQRSHNLQALKRCDVLFISRSEAGQVEWIARNASSRNILTIGDTTGFANRGIIVNFFLEQKKLRFEINAEAARRAGLAISSQVLRLGRLLQE